MQVVGKLVSRQSVDHLVEKTVCNISIGKQSQYGSVRTRIEMSKQNLPQFDFPISFSILPTIVDG